MSASVTTLEPRAVGSTGAHVSPGGRAEIRAVVQQAFGASTCDGLRVVIYGEELTRTGLDVRDKDTIADRLIGLIQEDASNREQGRHSYHVHALREGSVVYSSIVRVNGAAASGGGGAANMEPTASGALKVLARQNEALVAAMLKSHTVVLESQQSEIERLRERTETLEEQNDKLRTELSIAKAGGQADLARAEAERVRSEMIAGAGKQLIRYLPHVLRTWFPMPDEEEGKKGKKGEKGTPPPAPPAVVRALSSVTDAQLEAAGDVLGATQREIIGRARAGTAITMADAIACMEGLSDGAIDKLYSILREDQLQALLSAMASIPTPEPKD